MPFRGVGIHDRQSAPVRYSPPVQLPLSLGAPASRMVVLGSGSAGNALVLECDGRRLLVDAGFSCKQIEHRLELVGLDGDGFDGIVLTHEHGDHCRGAARFARRHGFTVHATAGHARGAGLLEADFPTVTLRSGAVLRGGRLRHRAVCRAARCPRAGRAGHRGPRRSPGRLAADLGARSQLAWGRLSELDALVLETNHDLEMLRSGPYPWPLKQRVAGRHGHLSNREAADGVPELLCDRLRWVVALPPVAHQQPAGAGGGGGARGARSRGLAGPHLRQRAGPADRGGWISGGWTRLCRAPGRRPQSPDVERRGPAVGRRHAKEGRECAYGSTEAFRFGYGVWASLPYTHGSSVSASVPSPENATPASGARETPWPNRSI